MAFSPGKSGNPAGRKAGQPNRLTMAARGQIAAGADPIAFLQRVVLGEAVIQPDGCEVIPSLDQRIRAAMTLANKLVPDARDSHVRFEIGHLDGPEAALRATGVVAERMAAGDLTPAEANAAINVLGQYAKTYELNELERRITSLEATSAIAPKATAP